jgi:hypothetical protein
MIRVRLGMDLGVSNEKAAMLFMVDQYSLVVERPGSAVRTRAVVVWCCYLLLLLFSVCSFGSTLRGSSSLINRSGLETGLRLASFHPTLGIFTSVSTTAPNGTRPLNYYPNGGSKTMMMPLFGNLYGSWTCFTFESTLLWSC